MQLLMQVRTELKNLHCQHRARIAVENGWYGVKAINRIPWIGQNMSQDELSALATCEICAKQFSALANNVENNRQKK